MSDYDCVTGTTVGEWAKVLLFLLLVGACLWLVAALLGWAELLIRWVLQ